MRWVQDVSEDHPKAVARDARRQAILAVAREVFMEDGYAAASMSAIAARVGGSKGTLYNYFPSKEDLFTAVIQDECELKQAALFDNLTAEGDDATKVLREVGRRYTSMVLSERTIAFKPRRDRRVHPFPPARPRHARGRPQARARALGGIRAARDGRGPPGRR